MRDSKILEVVPSPDCASIPLHFVHYRRCADLQGVTVLHHVLKKARLEAGLTTAKAADKLGLSQSSLSRMETGDIAVSSQRLIDLARLYGVSPSKLLDGAVVRALAEEDLNRLGRVITFVEDVLQGQEIRPSPKTIRDTILAIFRQESEAAWESGAEFNPARYRDLISVLTKRDS